MSVQIADLSKSFGAVQVLKSISETFQTSQLSVLLGSSGCGKTTTLRCIAGLERPTGGAVRIGGRMVSDAGTKAWTPVEKRGVSMVFQSYAIWPHMTVFENVALPLKAAGVAREDIRRRVREALNIVGLGELEDRGATRLSGGQQQRVALARCVVSDASVILMDEPLSNLDAKLRVAMRSEIKQLQQKLHRTILFVTHDQEEALSLADEVFLFRDGAIVQKGAPRDIYEFPHTRYVAEFLGKANIFGATADREALESLAPGLGARTTLDASKSLCLRPEKISLTPPEPGSALVGRIDVAMYMGERSEYQVSTPLGSISVVETTLVNRRAGDLVGLRADPEDARIVDEDLAVL